MLKIFFPSPDSTLVSPNGCFPVTYLLLFICTLAGKKEFHRRRACYWTVRGNGELDVKSESSRGEEIGNWEEWGLGREEQPGRMPVIQFGDPYSNWRVRERQDLDGQIAFCPPTGIPKSWLWPENWKVFQCVAISDASAWVSVLEVSAPPAGRLSGPRWWLPLKAMALWAFRSRPLFLPRNVPVCLRPSEL